MLVTYQGVEFDYINPTVDMINIKDIVYSLSRLNRFVGHSTRAYSVAEHSYKCYELAKQLKLNEREQLLVLIHDFTEAYMGDCPAPLKRLIPDFSAIEERVEHVIYEFVGISPPTKEEYEKIKFCDLTMLAIEMRDLTSHDYREYIPSDMPTLLDVIGISVSKEKVDESVFRLKLNQAYTELLEPAKKFKKYKVIYGLKDNEIHEEIEYHLDFESAYNSAFENAKDLYYENPPKDAYEMMKEDNLSEDVAMMTFQFSMANSIEYDAKLIEE